MYSTVGGWVVLAGKNSCGDGEHRVKKGGAEHKIERLMLIVVEEDGGYFDKCYGEWILVLQ